MGIFDWAKSEAESYGLIAPPKAADTVADMQPFTDNVNSQASAANVQLNNGIVNQENEWDARQNDQQTREESAKEALAAEEATGAELTPAQKQQIYASAYRNTSYDGMANDTDPTQDPYYDPSMANNDYYTN
jgi:hypothetical protein